MPPLISHLRPAGSSAKFSKYVCRDENVALSAVEMAESDGVSAGQREELQSARAPATLILCRSFIIVKQRNLVGLVLINLFKKKAS
jgi:hypothetical protein